MVSPSLARVYFIYYFIIFTFDSYNIYVSGNTLFIFLSITGTIIVGMQGEYCGMLLSLLSLSSSLLFLHDSASESHLCVI